MVLRDEKPIFQVPTAGPTERICEDCGGPYCWSADGTKIIYNRAYRDAERIGDHRCAGCCSGKHHTLYSTPVPAYVARVSFDAAGSLSKAT
jgi:hypothetical protein